MEDPAKRKKYLQYYKKTLYYIKNVPNLNRTSLRDCFEAANVIVMSHGYEQQIQQLLDQPQKTVWKYYKKYLRSYKQLYRLATYKKPALQKFDIDPKLVPQQNSTKQKQKQKQKLESKEFWQKIKDFCYREQSSSSEELKGQEVLNEQTSTSISFVHEDLKHVTSSLENLQHQIDLVKKLLTDDGWPTQIQPQQSLAKKYQNSIQNNTQKFPFKNQ